MRLIAERAGIVTYAVDYQLAPEAKYPTQIEEIDYVVRWVFDHADEQGIDPAKISVGGDSAGGNMTCVIALKLRDDNGPRLACRCRCFPRPRFPLTPPRRVKTALDPISSQRGSLKWCAIWSRTATTFAIPTARRSTPARTPTSRLRGQPPRRSQLDHNSGMPRREGRRESFTGRNLTTTNAPPSIR